jgi:hypothetical protein
VLTHQADAVVGEGFEHLVDREFDRFTLLDQHKEALFARCAGVAADVAVVEDAGQDGQHLVAAPHLDGADVPANQRRIAVPPVVAVAGVLGESREVLAERELVATGK